MRLNNIIPIFNPKEEEIHTNNIYNAEILDNNLQSDYEPYELDEASLGVLVHSESYQSHYHKSMRRGGNRTLLVLLYHCCLTL
jgi:hypothetical protein